MTLAIMGLLAWLTATTYLRWRELGFRTISWRLYALRDRLRWAAIEDRSLLASHAFWTLDEVLTAHCATGEMISLWTMVPFWMMAPSSVRRDVREHRRKVEAEFAKPEFAKMAPIYREAQQTFGLHLMLRHLVLFALLLPTILGVVVLLSAVTRASKAIVSGAVAAPVGSHRKSGSSGPLVIALGR